MKTLVTEKPEVFDGRRIAVPVFLFLAFVWTVFAQSALHQRALSWFPLLLGVRVGLAGLAVGLAVASALRPSRRNVLAAYLTLCALLQSVFAVLEGPNQVEYYQYVSYFVFLAGLSFNGPFRRWLRVFLPLGLVALGVPLFFKAPDYFASVGAFAFTFTTPLAMLFLAVMVVRVASGKYEALQTNLALREELLAVTARAKEELARELELAKARIAADAKKAAFADVALDVAHNIRSPLASLELKLNEVSIAPPERAAEIRDAVHRIRDIANQLVQHGQRARLAAEARPVAPARREPLSDELIPLLVDTIVSEKRIEHRARLDLRIQYRLTAESHGLFAKIQTNEFRIVLSNLINNAVEACVREGLVEVRVRPGRESGVVEVVVIDNGVGVPAEVVERLGERGLSIGKPNGNGLGLAHAREAAERWGGRVILLPLAAGGTEARLVLPCVPAPSWFARDLAIPSGAEVVVVDDDVSVHALWKSRLKGHRITHISTPEEFARWKAGAAGGERFYLVDLQFTGHEKNGLDLIREHQIASQSVLVTSHADSPGLRTDCTALGVRVLPKAMAGLLRFESVESLGRV